MHLKDLDIVKLLPQFMQSDPDILALSEAINLLIKVASEKADTFSVWDELEALSDDELDELAEELNVLWYDKNSSRQIKIDLIKDSDLVYAKLGTNWAVEQVIKTYFGSGKVIEWFEYGGSEDHHKFRVISNNPSITSDRRQEFLEMLEKVKRKSAVLDDILVTLTRKMPLYVAAVVRRHTHVRYYMNLILDLRRIMPLYAGVIMRDFMHEKYIVDFKSSDILDEIPLYVGIVTREKIVERHSILN